MNGHIRMVVEGSGHGIISGTAWLLFEINEESQVNCVQNIFESVPLLYNDAPVDCYINIRKLFNFIFNIQ
jgi:hypothetical protein